MVSTVDAIFRFRGRSLYVAVSAGCGGFQQSVKEFPYGTGNSEMVQR
jgi:hypothetical protein